MLPIESVDHVGIRVSDKEASVAFYRRLGFALIADAGFAAGHPVILRHRASGVTLNLLGPSTAGDGGNILMDIEAKHPGITHVALRVSSLKETRALLEAESIPITGSFHFGRLEAVFIRDPDRNVIELDELSAAEGTDEGASENASEDYAAHP